MKARVGGRRGSSGEKVLLKDRRSPRRRGRTGTSVMTRLTAVPRRLDPHRVSRRRVRAPGAVERVPPEQRVGALAGRGGGDDAPDAVVVGGWATSSAAAAGAAPPPPDPPPPPPPDITALNASVTTLNASSAMSSFALSGCSAFASSRYRALNASRDASDASEKISCGARDDDARIDAASAATSVDVEGAAPRAVVIASRVP